MKNIIVSLILCILPFTLLAQKQYDAAEIRSLVAFLNQPSAEQGKTNAEAIGITVEVTEANVAEWEKKMDISTKNEGGIEYIAGISLENKGNFRLGGSFGIENFKYLRKLFLYSMGTEVMVKNCPELGEFRLMGKHSEEHCKERKLEIADCPKLQKIMIRSLVTEYILNGSNSLTEVNINYTDFPNIDFSTQTQLKWLVLNNNTFSQIRIPEANKWSLECQYNQLEPADLMAIIRKLRGDDLYLDERFPTVEYTPQRIIYRDSITGSDLIPVETIIDLRPKATFKYGNPEKTYTGTFKWQYQNGTDLVDITPVHASMKQGVYTIPANMADRTIVATYECEPFFTGDKIQYFINAISAKMYSLKATPNNDDFGTVSGSGNYQAGKTVKLEAKPFECYRLVEWTINDSTISEQPKFDYIMPAHHVEIKALFEALPCGHNGYIPKEKDLKCYLQVLPNDKKLGYACCSGWYKVGTEVWLKATPKPNAKFLYWEYEGVRIDGNIFVMPNCIPGNDTPVIAVFEEKKSKGPTPPPQLPKEKCYLEVVSEDPDLGDACCSDWYEVGTKVTLKPTPNQNARFLYWKYDDAQIDGNNFVMPSCDGENPIRVIAVFEKLPDTPPPPTQEDTIKYRLDVIPNNPTLGKVSGSGHYRAGKEAPISATVLKKEAIFRNWTIDSIPISDTAYYLYRMPAHDVTIVGNFEYKDTTDTLSRPYLILTSNLWCAKLSGDGRYVTGTSVKVSATAPTQYKFKGWFLDKELISDQTNFTYPINEECNICLHAVYSDTIPPPKPSVFDGKYACTFHFTDNNIPGNPGMELNMIATGFIEHRPKTKDLWSPYSENNLGVISFDLGMKRHEIWNKIDVGAMEQHAGFIALTIFEVTDKEIIASGGGYLFGLEVFLIRTKFTKILRIPYTLNNDGSVTLKNFNITDKDGQPSYDITFYPSPNAEIEKKILWSDRPELHDTPETHEKDTENLWKYIRQEIMPQVYEQLKNK